MARDPAADWDARYATSGLVWSAEPNRWAAEILGGLPPGRALDLGTGEGRHAVWLARRGWEVTAVDFSGEAIRKAAEHQRANAPETVGRITWVRADVVAEPPAPGSADAVLLTYLHLPAAGRRRVLRSAAAALAPGGTLLLVGHDLTNLREGTGGPQDPAVLLTVADLVRDLDGLTGLEVRRAERVDRPVAGGAVAIDTLLHVVRLAPGAPS